MLRGYARSGGTGTPDTVAGPALLLLHGGPAITDYMDLLGTEVAGWRAIRYQQRCLSALSRIRGLAGDLEPAG
jgi:hypothetical protein